MNSNKTNVPHRSTAVNVQHTPSPFDNYVLVDQRPSPFLAAEKVRRDYLVKLDRLLSDYEHELTTALNVDSLSPTYQLGEIAGYMSRAGRVLRRREQLAIDRAAEADRRWNMSSPTRSKEHPKQ